MFRRFLFSRIWSSAQDHALLDLLLNLVVFFISTRPRWSDGNDLNHSCTSFEGASWVDQSLNIFTWFIGAGGIYYVFYFSHITAQNLLLWLMNWFIHWLIHSLILDRPRVRLFLTVNIGLVTFTFCTRLTDLCLFSCKLTSARCHKCVNLSPFKNFNPSIYDLASCWKKDRIAGRHPAIRHWLSILIAHLASFLARLIYIDIYI